MDQSIVLQTNIFFYITSAAVIVVSSVVAVGLYYFVHILRNVRDLTDIAKREGENIAEDITELRENIRDQGSRLIHLVEFFVGRTGRSKSRRKNETPPSSESESDNSSNSYENKN